MLSRYLTWLINIRYSWSLLPLWYTIFWPLFASSTSLILFFVCLFVFYLTDSFFSTPFVYSFSSSKPFNIEGILCSGLGPLPFLSIVTLLVISLLEIVSIYQSLPLYPFWELSPWRPHVSNCLLESLSWIFTRHLKVKLTKTECCVLLPRKSALPKVIPISFERNSIILVNPGKIIGDILESFFTSCHKSNFIQLTSKCIQNPITLDHIQLLSLLPP